MKAITRRKAFGILLAGVAAPITCDAILEPRVISASDPGAEYLEVYDAGSGEIQNLVKTVAVGQWIDQYELSMADAQIIKIDENGEPLLCRKYGDFRVRPR